MSLNMHLEIKVSTYGISITQQQSWEAGRTQDFLKGGANFFPCIVASRVRKSTLCKLFTMLQASSVLPHSKKT